MIGLIISGGDLDVEENNYGSNFPEGISQSTPRTNVLLQRDPSMCPEHRLFLFIGQIHTSQSPRRSLEKRLSRTGIGQRR